MIDSNDISGKTFVLIGGDVQLINSLERVLQYAGAIVYAATTAQKGLSHVLNIRPDLVILEDSLQDMVFSEVIETLQANTLTKQIPALVISDSDNASVYIGLFKSGIQDYLAKNSLNNEELLVKVKYLIEHGGYEREVPIFDFTDSDVNISKTGGAHFLKVLIIEDDSLLRNLLSLKLQKNSIEHKFCHSGDEAIGMVNEYNPTIVILDLMLPGKNGMEVLRELRQSDKTADLPVIIFSNKDDDSERETARSLKVEHFLVKATTDLRDLINLMAKLGK
jgi:DNA-binding response OmpR family regulator